MTRDTLRRGVIPCTIKSTIITVTRDRHPLFADINSTRQPG